MPDFGIFTSMAFSAIAMLGSAISTPEKVQFVIVLIMRALGMA